jgi:hypothetical protein
MLVLACISLTAVSLADVVGTNSSQPYRLPDNYELAKSRIDERVIGEMNSRSSRESQIDYLISTLDGNTNNIERCSAIRLLGMTESPKAIQPLLRNIDLRDAENRTYPAIHALAEVGTNAVPDIIKFIEISDDKQKMALAVQSIVEIMGSHYSEYVDRNKRSFSPKVKDALLRYGFKF